MFARRTLALSVTLGALVIAAAAAFIAHARSPVPRSQAASDALRQRLTPLQYRVTQQDATEPPFHNAHWNNKRPGIYVDLISGDPLFSSQDKFRSGTGWPSFTRPIEPRAVVTHRDASLGMVRTEVRSRVGDAHLGHLFDDGPRPTGKRYCINSAALRFVPAERLELEGYGAYLNRFGRAPQHRRLATLAGGCFWGMEEILRKLPGVLETTVGYTGGHTDKPSYEQVSSGKTGHAESVQLVYDPRRLSYDKLLDTFFRMHDPTTRNRQGNDRGSQYRSAIFVHGADQRTAARAAIKRANRSGRWKAKVVTEVVPAGAFTPAERYHQDYLQRNPSGYTCHFLRD